MAVSASDEQQIEALSQFGYDAAMQTDWQKKVADGTYAAANNVVDATLAAPPQQERRQQLQRHHFDESGPAGFAAVSSRPRPGAAVSYMATVCVQCRPRKVNTQQKECSLTIL